MIFPDALSCCRLLVKPRGPFAAHFFSRKNESLTKKTQKHTHQKNTFLYIIKQH